MGSANVRASIFFHGTPTPQTCLATIINTKVMGHYWKAAYGKLTICLFRLLTDKNCWSNKRAITRGPKLVKSQTNNKSFSTVGSGNCCVTAVLADKSKKVFFPIMRQLKQHPHQPRIPIYSLQHILLEKHMLWYPLLVHKWVCTGCI